MVVSASAPSILREALASPSSFEEWAMSRNAVRAVACVLSIVVTTGIGLVTNLLTSKATVALGVSLGALVLCASVLGVMSVIHERRESAGSETSIRRKGASPNWHVAGRSTAVAAGNNVSLGISNGSLVAIVAILAGVAAVAIVFSAANAKGSRSDAPPPPVIAESARSAPTSPHPSGQTLHMEPGFAYDIDAPAGAQPPNFGWQPSAGGDAERDLYLTGPRHGLPRWQIYVPKQPLRDVENSRMTVMPSNAVPADCLAAKLGSRRTLIDSVTDSAGTKACLKTGEGRLAMIEVVKFPDDAADLADVRVTLLA
jgi:hypothetical protein